MGPEISSPNPRAPRAPPRSPLPEGPFDLAIVGGGINGAAIARDAVLRGKSVVLLEKGDFGHGTSSRSSKMAHGGIRYLEQLRFGLVFESLRERGLLFEAAPHLVRPQSFVLPIYAGARRGPAMVRLGLFLYDLLAIGRRPGRCRSLAAAEIAARVPELLRDGLAGGGLYFDGVMDDARLVLANAIAAEEEARPRGGEVFLRNYARVEDVHQGSPCSLRVEDLITGATRTVLAHHVVRALGPWTEPERLVPSKGAHIVLPPLPMSDGLLLTHSKDGRVFFIIPWLGMTVVGTTETPFTGSPDDLRVEPEEVNYLLGELRRLFPKLALSPRDILGTFAGVRPLARSSGLFRGSSPGAVSRVHRITDDGDGVVSVYGGKYTTYRAVAKDVLDHVFPGTVCLTRGRPLPGGEAGAWEAFRGGARAEIEAHGEAEVERLFRRYGSRLRAVLALARANPALGERIAGAVEMRAEVVHSILHENVHYPEDFIERRTTLRYSPDGGRGAYDAVEAILREHAGQLPRDLQMARERYFARMDWEDRLRGM